MSVTGLRSPEAAPTRAPVVVADRARRLLPILVAAAVLLALPHVLDSYWLFLARMLAVNFVAAAALNVLSGNAGQFSLGNGAFLAVGAYSGAFLWVQLDLPLAVVIVGVAVTGAVAGLVVGLPALRLHGIYLLMSTLAAHFIVVFAASKYQVANVGVVGVRYPEPPLRWLHHDPAVRGYYLVVVLAVVVYVLLRNLLGSAFGRAIVGVRDRDVAAAACGIAVGRTKLTVWALTSSLISVAGLFQAMTLGTASIEYYTLGLAISYVAMTIIGGMSSLTGSLLGAIFVTGTPEVISAISDRFASEPFSKSIWAHPFELQRIAYGAAIVLFVLLAPDGLVGLGGRVSRVVRRHRRDEGSS